MTSTITTAASHSSSSNIAGLSNSNSNLHSTSGIRPLRPNRKIGGISTTSTPNLNAAFAAHSKLVPPALSRKASFAALTQNSLASIPDATESYALDTVLSETAARKMAPAPLTPAKPAGAGDDLAIGDTVEVPGNMYGTVRFVGSVQGRKGTFAGVELHADFASRGKNNGDVDGVSYFTTTAPGAGIFLPVAKAVKRESPSTSAASSFPMTPTTGAANGLKVGNQNSTNFTPPTPSLPKFSQSLGPGRASSPSGKRPRTSLPRPDSPVRRLQMTPAGRPSIATPAAKGPARYGSPTNANKFSQSVRGPAPGDPSKRGLARPDRKTSIPPRSASALGGQVSSFTDDETTPVGVGRTMTNGSVGSVSSLNLKGRPGSRAAAHNNEEELERLRAQLDERDRQLKEQAATLAEMESSLVEVQDLMQHADAPRFRRNSLDDKDSASLRALVREKNDKIAMLTAEFDAHRADFRSTIDTLEMASTETERVYEKKIDELMQEIHDLQERTSDVDTVASQLKQLEELVQELEEGLEDARRGEAEARGEVEFLRGEVERTRSELRREREKASTTLNGTNGLSGDRSSISKDLEQKEDEIRGLKAIIHSLSRDSVPGDVERPLPPRSSSFQAPVVKESLDSRMAREKLEREVSELRSLLDNKSNREEEMEREIEALRRGSATTHRGSAMTIGSTAERSSIRDSRGTVILAREHEPRSPEARKTHSRGLTLDTMPESDAFSSATETSTLWCEICETNGHDILTCTNMFGPQGDQPNGEIHTGKDVVREGLKPLTLNVGHEDIAPAPLSPMKTKAPTSVPTSVKILPNPMESGPVAGKESGVVDAGKWCALCERDGHDSVDCPFEDAF